MAPLMGILDTPPSPSSALISLPSHSNTLPTPPTPISSYNSKFQVHRLMFLSKPYTFLFHAFTHYSFCQNPLFSLSPLVRFLPFSQARLTCCLLTGKLPVSLYASLPPFSVQKNEALFSVVVHVAYSSVIGFITVCFAMYLCTSLSPGVK